MQAVLNSVDGYKTYIALALGAAVIVANHFGIKTPGVDLNGTNWINDLWTLVLVATGRSAVTKVAS